MPSKGLVWPLCSGIKSTADSEQTKTPLTGLMSPASLKAHV